MVVINFGYYINLLSFLTRLKKPILSDNKLISKIYSIVGCYCKHHRGHFPRNFNFQTFLRTEWGT